MYDEGCDDSSEYSSDSEDPELHHFLASLPHRDHPKASIPSKHKSCMFDTCELGGGCIVLKALNPLCQNVFGYMW